MKESFVIAVWQHLAEQSRRFVQWICYGRSGLWIAALVVVLVVGRFLQMSSECPAHLDEIAETFGSVGYLFNTPQSDRSGSRITFIQTTTNGIAVFLCDTTTGLKQMINEKNGGVVSGDLEFGVWPWSPDDRLFLYTRGNILICRGDTGAQVAEVLFGHEPIKDLAWLTPDTFTCVSGATNRLNVVHREGDGTWKRSILADVEAGSSLVALSTNTLAWNRNNCIWIMNLDSNAVTLFYQAPTNQTLDAFAFLKDTGKFIMKLKQANHADLWQVSSRSDPEPVAACPADASAISWLNTGNCSYAYQSSKSVSDPDNVLTLQSGSPDESSRLFAGGFVKTFTSSPDGRHLFIVGVVSNEPAEGIWQYDVASKNLQCVVPGTPQLSPYARHVAARHGICKLASGHNMEYYLYPPVNFDRRQHKKYPLVIGSTLYLIPDGENQHQIHGPLWAEALACCDAYVVIVKRGPYWHSGLIEWETNVLQVYNHLAQDPTIDTRRVYLFGASAETGPLSKLAEDRPELWNGLFLLSPAQLPDIAIMPPGKPAPRMLISAGKEEGNGEYLKRYQSDAGQKGVAVDVVIHPNTTHWLISIAAMQERTKAMVDFIYNN
jgi:hypothetical protein